MKRRTVANTHRREPYTEIGIRRLKCSRKGCRRRGYASWQICANGRAFKPLCFLCDIAINRLVLEWMGDPQIERKMATYAAKVIARVNAGNGG